MTLLRIDPQQMRTTITTLQQGNDALRTELASAQRAMQAMQGSAWAGNHRTAAEQLWEHLAQRFDPTADQLDDLARRLQATLAAYEEAASVFGGASSAGGAASAWQALLGTATQWLAELGAVINAVPPALLPLLGVLPGNPLALLNGLLNDGQPSTGGGMSFSDDAYSEAAYTVCTGRLPNRTDISFDGPVPPRTYILNGINSDAAPGTMDGDVHTMLEQMRDRGYDMDQVVGLDAVYNTNLGTNLQGSNLQGTNLQGSNWFTNGLAGLANTVTGAGAAGVNTFTAVDAALTNGATGLLNTAMGAGQVSLEYTLGSNGRYTDQVYREIMADLDAHPLLQGQTMTLIAHSGGGAIMTNVTGMLEAQNRDVGNVVLLGSPMANVDAAAQRANVLDAHDQMDLIGRDWFRSNEGRSLLLRGLVSNNPVLGLGLAHLNDGTYRDQAHVNAATMHSGHLNPLAAHSAVWTQDETYRLFHQFDPSLPTGEHVRYGGRVTP